MADRKGRGRAGRAALLALAHVALATPTVAGERATVPAPPALKLDGVPEVPVSLAEQTRPYMEFRSASFLSWDLRRRGMLIATRFGDSNQLHAVAAPGAARQQLTFEAEPVAGGAWSRGQGDVLLAVKDVGGNENFQLYRVEDGRLTRLTDGRSRNTGAIFSPDGRLVAWASNARNGRDMDLWVMDPRDPASKRLVAERQGGGWAFADIFPDGRSALVEEVRSVVDSRLWRLDLETGALVALTSERRPVAFAGARVAPDGRILVASDRLGEFRELGLLDPASGTFRRLGPPGRHDVETFDIAPDGRTVAVVTNEAGVSRLRLLDSATGAVLLEPELPVGVILNLAYAPWGELGFTLSSAQSPADAWSLDPATGAIRRWTVSETGGLDPAANRTPEMVTVRSFDGRAVSGFLYRPDPARFPGPRPLLVSIHGGPEAQSRPVFQGRNNFLLNEWGIALFYPNVRGSTGYGKTFVNLDNGPWKREDSVKDIAAMVGHLKQDPGLDGSRFGVTGGSYGGYMTYAAMTLYPELWRAGLAIVAISDFETFLKNTSGYRVDLRRVEYGDERDPRQVAKLRAISPLRRADRIRAPLFVVTGANDPRVPASEADQMIGKVRGMGKEAWHLVADNEGHGFRRKDNLDYQFWTSLLFWERHLLGGR